MQRNVAILLIALVITLSLTACENTPLPPVINADQAIKSAKAAAIQLKFPPRRADEGITGGMTITPQTYYTHPNEVALWPDSPGTAQIPPSTPLPPFSNFPMPQEITTTTLESKVSEDGKGGGVLVTFTINWPERESSTAHHSWQFHVDNALKTSFLGESGDDLLKVVVAVP